MSLIDGPTPSADWVALDMEAMLRECDALVASKDEHLARLTAGIAALQAQIEQTRAERAEAAGKREGAERVLEALRTAVEAGTGLRQASEESQAGPHDACTAADHEEDPPSECPSAPKDPTDDAAPQAATEPEPDTAPIRIHGERSVAVMRIVTLEPDRRWTPKDIAVRLEGLDQAQEQDSHNRARALLDSLAKRNVLHKTRDGGGQRCAFLLAAEWEAA
ncbi:hypothetical protein ACFVT1_16945 [Streptomyces sp. NPDC057963]|uniref:hypothetical protein n=1 Tax=Streptomyces sp. NPDC057963 TaxID=3346290 RepID=UPI0036EC82C9